VRPLLRMVALVLGLTLVAGCGASLSFDDDGSARVRAQAEAVVEEVRRAVEQAKQRRTEQSGAVDRSASADGQLRTDTQTEFDYEEYSGTLATVFASLEEYWGQELPRSFGVAFTPPADYVYYRPEERSGPRCGTELAPARNAFYCPAGDFIAWDESGLVIPFYVRSGDFAAAFVLAHEFGHAMQARLPRRERLTILSELQADCFAGAWSRHVQEQGMLEAGDLDEATLAVFSARDLPGTPFTDPRAHGSGFERTRAFTDGYKDGTQRCYPAPEDWLIAADRT
jgi:predicted metalloprotease